MKAVLPALLLAGLAVVRSSAGTFPYPVRKKTLPNGLDIVVIETPEFKDVLNYNTMVLAGSGREADAGRTGLAHLFEHILFRHRLGGREGGYDEAMTALGTHNNAWTWFDITYYFPLTFASNLSRSSAPASSPGLVELEPSRFKNLDLSEKTFRTEAGAVLGEYRRHASRPSSKLEERLTALMFPDHPYGHTTIGYYQDVLDMPSHFEAAKKFYDTYYRPNNCVLVVSGDVKAEEVFSKAEAEYRDWKPGTIPAVPAGRAPEKERKESLAWDADVAPVLWVSYAMPAFVPGTPPAAAAQLLGELLLSPAAPLYKKLRYEKQAASELEFAEGSRGFESFDPRFLTVAAQLYKDKLAAKGPAYFEEVAGDIIAAMDDLKSFSKQPGAAELLGKLKSKYRYDFLARLDSAEHIAATFSWYYRFGRDPQVLDKLLSAIEAVKPEDIDALAAVQFVPQKRVVLSLAYKGKAP